MPYAIKHALSEVEWADGTVVDLPPISRSQNGWVYRPTEAQYRGSGKSFGKGVDGDTAAQNWLASRIQKAFERKNWELPTNLPKPENLPDLTGDTVQVGWNHPVFGGVWMDLTYGRNRWSRNNERTLTLVLHYSIIAEDIASRVIKYHDRLAATRTTSFTAHGDDKDLLVRYNEFREDPWAFAQRHLDLTPELVNLISPTVELPPVDYSGQKLTEELPAWYRMSGNVDLLFDENAEKYLKDNMGDIERLILAFEHLGFEVHVGWTWHDYGDRSQIPNEVSVTIPGDPKKKGYEEPHKITFRPTGVKIECGFVREEQNYIEYQQRHAKAFMQDLLDLEDEWTTTEKPL